MTEKDLIMLIKDYCLSHSYIDEDSLGFSNGLDCAKAIILEKIRYYECQVQDKKQSRCEGRLSGSPER